MPHAPDREGVQFTHVTDLDPQINKKHSRLENAGEFRSVDAHRAMMSSRESRAKSDCLLRGANAFIAALSQSGCWSSLSLWTPTNNHPTDSHSAAWNERRAPTRKHSLRCHQLRARARSLSESSGWSNVHENRCGSKCSLPQSLALPAVPAVRQTPQADRSINQTNVGSQQVANQTEMGAGSTKLLTTRSRSTTCNSSPSMMPPLSTPLRMSTSSFSSSSSCSFVSARLVLLELPALVHDTPLG